MVAVGDIYELAVNWTEATQGTQCINVFHFRQKAGFLSAINLIGEFQAGIQTQYRALVTSGLAISRYSCRSLIPYNTDFYETFPSPTLAGTGGTTPVPPVCAGIITWRTGQPGRRKRGRTYIAGISQTQHTGGRLSASFITTWMNAFGNQALSLWAAGGSSATTEIGVWSRLNAGPSPPFDPAGFQVITAFTAQPAMGSMGSRRFGRGI
jgi:hypothetical protein